MSIARAMATSCCTASECDPSSEAGSMSRLTRASSSRACGAWRRQSIPPKRRGSRPSMMFSATVRFAQRFTSWYTVLMPAAWACGGPPNDTVRPSSVMAPESIW